MRLAGVLWHLWQMRGYLREGRQRFAALLAMPGASAPSLARARVVEGAGVLALYQGDALAARPLFKESLALYRQFDDGRRRAWVLIYLAWLSSDMNYAGAGRRFAMEALQLCERHGDRYGMSRALNLLGLLTWQRGDYQGCFPLHQRSLDISRELGDRWGTAWALHRLCVAHLTRVLRGEAQVQPALPLITEEIALWVQLGERRHLAFSLCNRGVAAAFGGCPADAYADLRQGLSIFTDLDDMHGMNFVLAECSIACSAEGRAVDALRIYAAAVERASRPGMTRRLPKLWRDVAEQYETAVRNASGEAAVAAAWEEGRAMSPDEVMACVEGDG